MLFLLPFMPLIEKNLTFLFDFGCLAKKGDFYGHFGYDMFKNCEYNQNDKSGGQKKSCVHLEQCFLTFFCSMDP